MQVKTRLILSVIILMLLTASSTFAAKPAVSISAAPATVVPGGSSTLTWTSSNAVSATINNGIGTVALSGSIQVTPTITTKYTITVGNGTGRTASARVTVTVSGDSSKVGITSFVATPASVPIGIPTPVSLSWTTINATSVTIDNNIGSVALNGSLPINPVQTTTYILTAKGKGGSLTSSTTVTFRNPQPPEVSFSANPVTIQSGNSSTLSWNVNNASTIEIDNGIGSVSDTGSTQVSPPSNIIYTLTATNREGTTIASSGVYFGSSRPCYAYVPEFYYNSQGGENSYVKVIDTATNSIIKTIEVDNEPKGILIGNGGTCIYLSSTVTNKISKLDPISLKITESLTGIEGRPGEMASSISGNHVYAIGRELATLSVLDDTGPSMVLRKIITLPAIANSLTIHPDGCKLYVPIPSLNQILVLDTAKLNEALDGPINKPLGDELIDTIPITDPHHIQFNLDGSKMFACRGNDLVVMDTATRETLRSYLYVNPYMLALNPQGDRIYLLSTMFYYVINMQTLEINTKFRNSKGNYNENISLHPDGSRIYSIEASYFHTFDAENNIDLGYIDLINRASQIVIFHNSLVSYIPNTISGQVSQNDVPLSGALIKLEGEGILRETLSDTQGNYHFAVKDGTYHVEASYQNLFVNPEFIQVVLNGANVINQNFVFSGSAPSPSVDFFVNPTTIQAGETAILSWDSTNATSAIIDNGIGNVPVNGTMTVSPAQTTTYIITVTGPGGTATAATTVSVNSVPPPGIVFGASPTTIEQGQSSILTWTTTNAVSASIDNGIGNVPVNGSQAVTPQQTTTYIITVIGPGGSSNTQVTVSVTEPLPQVQFNADPAILPPGQSATLTWSSVNATSATIDNGIGTVPLSGSVSVIPTQDTIYNITVTGPGGTTMASVSVKMLAGHLQSIWGGMKTAMLTGDVDQVMGSFSAQTHDKYLAIFNSIADQLPQVAQEMREIEPVYFEEFGAKFRIKRTEEIEGVIYDITYYIYFVQEEDGSWKILNY